MHALTPRGDDGLIPSQRIRRPLRVALLTLTLAVAVESGVIAWLVIGRAASAEYRNAQIRQLACSLVRYTPPGSEPGDTIRGRYGCGPYGTRPSPAVTLPAPRSARPSSGPSSTRRARPAATRTVSPRGTAAPRPPHSTQPAARGVVGTSTPRSTHTPAQGVGRAPAPHPPTVTRVAPAPRPSTVTRVAPAPRPTPKGPAPLLPGLPLPSSVCGLAGLSLC